MTGEIPNLNPEQSRTLLGWNLVREKLSRLALSEVGQQRLLELLPEDSFEAARQLQEETAAMLGLVDSAEGFNLSFFSDLGPILQNAEQHGMIEPEQGLAVLHCLKLVRDISNRLKGPNLAPSLRHFTHKLRPLPEVMRELDRCLDPDGDLKENASPEYREALQEAATARRHLESSVQKLMARMTDTLQDQYFTEREGRVVLPVRTDSKGRMDGIVHDSSGSGQTLFIEPGSIVPLNNQVKIARMAVEREKARVLAQLAALLLQNQEDLEENLEALADLDSIHARARMAREMDAHPCELTRGGPLLLKEARNPELILNGREVIPNSLEWDESIRVLMISGPNTGGKTVTLKTLGLFAIMIRAGLLLPVKRGSRMPFYPEVYADIGDDQDISQDLSTFSGHLCKIISIFDHAQPGSLILLDELGIATDPEQGAALAESILLEMKSRGFMTLVSTHYLTLKARAQTEPGFLNACTQFDLDKMTPTYRLIFGAPGQSAALETAERLGLPPEILGTARELYSQRDNRADALLNQLTRQMQQLERDRDEVQKLQEEVRHNLKEQDTLRRRLKDEELTFRRSKSQKIQNLVRETRKELRQLMEQAREKKSLPELRKAEKRLHSMSHAAGQVPSSRRSLYTVPASRLKAGDEVMLDGYESIGIVEENPAGKTRVRVRLGNLTTVLETSRLFGHSQGYRTRPAEEDQTRVTIQTETESRPVTTCDLRGLNLEEARNAMELFLSQAVIHKMPRVTLVHGHGMGRVKGMVRDYLATTGIGKEFGPAPREQGGDGATIVDF